MFRTQWIASTSVACSLICWVSVFLGSTVVASAEPVATHARVDVRALAKGAELKEARWLFGDDSFVDRMDWLPRGDQAGSCFGEFAVLPFAAPSSVLTFVPSADTQLQVELAGQWRDSGSGKPQRLLVDWVRMKVSGARVVGDAFVPKTAWVNRPIRIKLSARKGIRVYLELAAKVHEDSAKPVSRSSRGFELAKQLRRGINVSHWLEVAPGDDWGDNQCDEKDVALMKQQGFDHVRLPVGWQHHVGPPPTYTIDRSIFRKVDRFVDQTTQAGLAIIINVHHFDTFVQNPRKERKKLLAIWRQLARHYAARPDNVFFEILNEPAENATTAVMSDFYREVLPMIRESNPTRGVLVAPGEFNSAKMLADLKLPADDQSLIVSVHCYDPFVFTHQRAAWTPPGIRKVSPIRFPGPPNAAVITPANAEDWVREWIQDFNVIQRGEYNVCGPMPVDRMLDLMKGWSQYHGRPMHLGEFGTNFRCDAVSRAAYAKSVRQACEQRGIGWAVWDWKSDFAYWNDKMKRPNHGLENALFDRP